MNNYLLESDNYILINNFINEIILKKDFSNIDKNIYNLTNVALIDAINDLDTYSFFDTKKTIIINNIEFKDVREEELNLLINYLNKPHDDNLLIITTPKMDERKKVYKAIKSLTNYNKLIPDIKGFAKEKLKDYKIDSDALKTLLEYSNDNIDKLYNDINILKAYKIEEKEILKEDIIDALFYLVKEDKDLSFEFVRYLSKKDIKNTLYSYEKLELQGVEPIAILGLIASQLRIIYKVKILSSRQLNNEDMKNILNEKTTFRINKTKEVINNFSKAELLELFKALRDLDIKMKSTDIDKHHLIKMFILQIK